MSSAISYPVWYLFRQWQQPRSADYDVHHGYSAGKFAAVVFAAPVSNAVAIVHYACPRNSSAADYHEGNIQRQPYRLLPVVGLRLLGSFLVA
jgi:hypothetical protein